MTKTKTILYNTPYLGGPGAITWIVASWREGFTRCGYEFLTCDDPARLDAMCRATRPDILFLDIVSTPIESAAFRARLAELRAAGTKVCLNVFWPLLAQPEDRIEALRRHDVADLYCGEREPDSMEAFTADCGKRYVTLPQSANPRFHVPTEPVARYAYDVVFVGAKLRLKRWFNEEVLPVLRRKHRVAVYGPGWTLRDNTLRALSKAARLGRQPGLARIIDRQRFYLPEEDENRLYSSSRIALNFHEREDDLSQPHHIVNQRTFKIAACGGFQIVDPVKAIGNYFGPDEIVTADLTVADWVAKVDHYLRHEDERRAIQRRATARAQNEHMAHHRVRFLERLLLQP